VRVAPIRSGAILLAAAAMLLASCGSSDGSHVARISISPWPGGPGAVIAGSDRAASVLVPLEAIQASIPERLPTNPPQGCREGARVTITLGNGTSFLYGPCDLPPAIEELRFAVVLAAARLHPWPTRPVSPDGREWKRLIEDWYDGHIDGWYPCAVVREAIRHLPESPPTFSTVLADFHAYATAVCSPRPA
jgi:hypothetical protein